MMIFNNYFRQMSNSVVKGVTGYFHDNFIFSTYNQINQT